ncbi:ribonuclease P protein component [Euzebya sp.]|uniref:ribonuclease P protein component n=1 Tax=Euzebya sp. TaxID=1971409 RepID=UPI003511810C
MPTPLRLRSSADIRGVFTARASWGSDQVVVHARSRGDGGGARVAVVAGRRVGGAVVRNRAKRRMRAVLASCDLPAGLDLVVSGRAGADSVPFAALEAQIADGIRRAGRRATR